MRKRNRNDRCALYSKTLQNLNSLIAVSMYMHGIIDKIEETETNFNIYEAKTILLMRRGYGDIYEGKN